jgi:N-acetylglucosamine-6-phosphate deacetylase
LTLIPGFIDVHVHGADGFDAMDAQPEALNNMARFYAQHGVTSFLATTWTDTRERIASALNAVKSAMGAQENGATLLGVHLEGPYLNPVKCGAQNVDYIRRAARDEATAFLDTGVIRLLSIAPEFDDNRWLIAECVRRGITVSIAHSDATYDQTCAAIDLGVSHATHTFNAMTGLHHRDPGIVGAVASSPDVRCELIADNIHVHPAAMRLLWLLKRPHNLVLISDAIRAVGKPDGDYAVDERTVYVRDGAARLEDGTLAGSTLTMDSALRNFISATGEPLENVWQCASLNPAKAINVSYAKGSIEINKDADLILVGADLDVRYTIASGKIIYQAH